MAILHMRGLTPSGGHVLLGFVTREARRPDAWLLDRQRFKRRSLGCRRNDALRKRAHSMG
eukprot:CAMPEP_0197914316 /NCGR_PEP_ID=MMETSP1439-20131203/78314_1 /TAXON_ID=66791 /ORGANISM="Gonyaulax spinifera, Strain CCMP409" /LENGTH=59 /DNA_ID=CAMNT_0043536225 /DNA_START=25 /DNA_END=200 /DNA_ORIENTATION=-